MDVNLFSFTSGAHLLFQTDTELQDRDTSSYVVTAEAQTKLTDTMAKKYNNNNSTHAFTVLMRHSEKPVFGKNVAPCRASTGPSGTLGACGNTEVSL